MGTKLKQRVVWDKFPLYCKECLHVGHASATCYASGKRPMPSRWTGTRTREKMTQPQRGGNSTGRDIGKEDVKVDKPSQREETGTGTGTRERMIQPQRGGNIIGRDTGKEGGKVDKPRQREEIGKSITLNKGKCTQQVEVDKEIHGKNAIKDDDGFQKQGRRSNNRRGSHKSVYLEHIHSDGEGARKGTGKIWKEKRGSCRRELPGSFLAFKQLVKEGQLEDGDFWKKSGVEEDDMSEEELETMYEGMYGNSNNTTKRLVNQELDRLYESGMFVGP